MKKEQLKELIKQEVKTMLTEKEANYSEAELKQVAQFTDRNQHFEARQYIARNGNYEKLTKAYSALIDLQIVRYPIVPV